VENSKLMGLPIFKYTGRRKINHLKLIKLFGETRDTMKVTFCGTRGSSLFLNMTSFRLAGKPRAFWSFFSTGRVAVLDAGTGIRKSGDDLLARAHGQEAGTTVVWNRRRR